MSIDGGDVEAGEFFGAGRGVPPGGANGQASGQAGGQINGQISGQANVTFDRHELNRILGLYGKMVAAGEWRDYAIDFTRDRAVFSVFRRSSEVPIYRIEKNPKLARKQGAYSVITATGLILKRGPDLARVLRVLDNSLKLVAN